MKRILLGALLTWAVSTQPGCQPWRLVMWDAYITGARLGTDPDNLGDPISPGYYSEGWKTMQPTQTTVFLGSATKPYLGCALAWKYPEAVDEQGGTLPPECQPFNFTADGQAWEGM